MILKVDRGLYVLRYIGSVDARSAPSASVRVAPDHAADLRIVDAPGCGAGLLAAPGASLVLVAERPAALDISVHPAPGSSNLEAKLSLDLLSPGARAPQDRLAGPDCRERTAVVAAMGHVARRGDVSTDAAGWIGGPSSPSAIEGLELHCSGADLGIEAQSLTAADRGRWSPWQGPGAFVGTRRQALPLTGLRLKLVGADAPAFDITAETLFLGSPILADRGAELVFASDSGSDPLVGLRIGLVPSAFSRVPPPAMERPEVRVYR